MTASAWLWARGNNGLTYLKLFNVLCKERRQLMGLPFIGVIVLPARFWVSVLWINARNVGGVIEIEALDVLGLGADE